MQLLQALGSVSTDADLFKELRKLCGRTGTLPSSHMLRGGLVKTSDIATASGGFGDVWKGAYKGRRVAIKSLRVCMTDDLDDIKRVRANVRVYLIRIDLVIRAGY